MIKATFKLSILTILCFSANTWSAISKMNTSNITCTMPENETLIIGCSNYCGRFNSWAVKSYARKLGYNVKLINLRSKNQTVDYSQVDGILFTGGSDIDPKWYIEKVTPEMKDHLERVKHLTNYSEIGRLRDEFEFDVLEKYFNNPDSKYQPILGICRGMQAIAVSQGMPLYVDIKEELNIKNRRYTLDQVTIQNKESLLQEIIGKSSFRGVELHHQGINIDYYNKHKAAWPNIEITALSNSDKIAESIEFYDRPVLGVQFHPEYTFGKVRRGIFKWLLKRSCFNHKFKNAQKR